MELLLVATDTIAPVCPTNRPIAHVVVLRLKEPRANPSTLSNCKSGLVVADALFRAPKQFVDPDYSTRALLRNEADVTVALISGETSDETNVRARVRGFAVASHPKRER